MHDFPSPRHVKRSEKKREAVYEETTYGNGIGRDDAGGWTCRLQLVGHLLRSGEGYAGGSGGTGVSG